MASITFENIDENLDIPIYDNSNKNSGGYAIGDLLNMPAVYGRWYQNPHHSEETYESFLNVSKQYPESILAIYSSLRADTNEPIPNLSKIEQAVDIYTIYTKQKHQILEDDQVLFIHLRSGDKGVVEDYYIEKINQVALKYRFLVVLAGIHADQKYHTTEQSKQNLIESFKKINNSKIQLNLDTADNHLVIMRKCKNLMVHKGGFSTLGCIVFTGDQLYLTELHECYQSEQLPNYLKSKHINYNIIYLIPTEFLMNDIFLFYDSFLHH